MLIHSAKEMIMISAILLTIITITSTYYLTKKYAAKKSLTEISDYQIYIKKTLNEKK